MKAEYADTNCGFFAIRQKYIKFDTQEIWIQI